jgi:hypothetical protein
MLHVNMSDVSVLPMNTAGETGIVAIVSCVTSHMNGAF